MKKVMIIATLICGAVLLANGVEPIKTEEVFQTEFCEGWEDGYCEGWKDVKGQYSYCPTAPYCPYAKYNCPKGYRCGYNRGFKAGMRAAYKSK